ncbi:unnamed protein product [Porites evermanni]|uniref:Uncharacterized protein n=1 Tax=Porites evermanni TaxID=104178 RepID=A0ABN8LQM6_9CNID|nr:unnamed protein product [Porites evermanni]
MGDKLTTVVGLEKKIFKLPVRNDEGKDVQILVSPSSFSPAVHCFHSWRTRDSDVYDLSHFCLHINEDDVRSSSFNHPITLYTEIPQNLCFLPLALECVCTTDMPIPVRPSHTVAMHIPRHAVMSPLVIKHWANMLHSLSLCTSYT